MSAQDDRSVAYGLPLRCACELHLLDQWLSQLYHARQVGGATLRARPEDGGLLASVVVTRPSAAARALLDTVIADSSARPLVYAALCVHGAATREEIVRRLGLQEQAVQRELGALFTVGLVDTRGAQWMARAWTRGGKA